MEAPLRYRAFLSYCHRDERAAKRLHRWLEAYSVPRSLRGALSVYGEVPARIQPVFRDRDELASASALSTSLQDALDASAALIVVCSPAAVASKWVNEEILYFRTKHPERPVLAFVVAGDPGMDPRLAPERSALPLRLALSEAADDAGALGEPVAADARSEGDGLTAAYLKIAAGLLGVRFDELRRRDFRRRQQRMAIVGTAATILAAIFAWLAWDATVARDAAREARDRAELELQSERQTREFLLSVFKLADAGEARGSTVTVREVLDRAVARIDATRFDRPAIKSRFLASMGQAYSSLGLARRSVELLRASIAALPADAQAPEQLAQRADSAIELADVLYIMGDYPAALEALGLARYDVPRDRRGVALRRARAQNVRGDVYSYTERNDEARRAYEDALAASDTRGLDAEEQALIRARARSGLAFLDYEAGANTSADAHFAAAMEALLATVGEMHPVTIATTASRAANAYAQRDYTSARTLWTRALANAEKVYDADNPEIGTIKNNLGRLLLETGDVAAAEPLLRDAIASDRKHRSAEFDDLAFSLHNLAYERWVQGDATEALGLLDEALPIAEAAKHRMLAPILNAIADIQCAQGRHDAGAPLAQRAVEVARANDAKHWTVQQAELTAAYCAGKSGARVDKAAARKALAAIDERFGKASAFAQRGRQQLDEM